MAKRKTKKIAKKPKVVELTTRNILIFGGILAFAIFAFTVFAFLYASSEYLG